MDRTTTLPVCNATVKPQPRHSTLLIPALLPKQAIVPFTTKRASCARAREITKSEMDAQENLVECVCVSLAQSRMQATANHAWRVPTPQEILAQIALLGHFKTRLNKQNARSVLQIIIVLPRLLQARRPRHRVPHKTQSLLLEARS